MRSARNFLGANSNRKWHDHSTVWVLAYGTAVCQAAFAVEDVGLALSLLPCLALAQHSKVLVAHTTFRTKVIKDPNYAKLDKAPYFNYNFKPDTLV